MPEKFDLKDKLFRQANCLRKEGGLILKESGLLEFLAKYGEIKISGSYNLNLMVNGDIDIYIVMPIYKKQKVIEALNELIKQDYFRGYYFGDYIKNPKEGFPQGYYIGLNIIRDNLFWKIDVWFVDKIDQEKENFMDFIQANLTDELKFEILKLKQERNDKKLDILSIDIYKQVFSK